MIETIVVTTPLSPGDRLLASGGLSTPHALAAEMEVSGGAAENIACAATGQPALAITATSTELTLRYTFKPGGTPYPDDMFRPSYPRHTRAAHARVTETKEIAPDLSGPDLACAMACARADRFTYGHPEARFTDGLDHVPALGCGVAEGSCADISTCLPAALRANGIEAGCVVGPFIPEDKGDGCEDVHCWVVTRHGGETLGYDIAHHLKLGARDVQPGLNPKPGRRYALGHSMGFRFPEFDVEDLKLLSNPVVIGRKPAPCVIRLIREAAHA